MTTATRPGTRPTITPLTRLARRRAERQRGHAVLLVAAIALPIGVGSLVLPVVVGPDPLAVVFLVGLVAVVSLSVGAVLAVSTRRQLLRYGRLAAIGADPIQIRWLLVLESLIPVVVGHVVGAAFGTAISVTAGPIRWAILDDWQPSGGMGRVGAVAVIVAIAQALLGAATVVGLWLAAGPAAVMVGRTPTEAATAAGPEPAPRPLQGRVGLGVVVLAIAYCVIADFNYSLLMLAVIAVFVGLHLMVGPVLVLLDRVSGRFPRPIRLAARNAARSRTRFGRLTMASVATVALGVMAAAGVLSDAPGSESSGYGWALDDRYVLVTDHAVGRADEALARNAIDVDREAELVVLDTDLQAVWNREGDSFSTSGLTVALFTAELATAIEADADTVAAIERGAIVLADGSRQSVARMGADGLGPDLDVHTARLGLGSAGPANPRRSGIFIQRVALIGPDLAAELGARPQSATADLLLVAEQPLTDDQRQRLAATDTGRILIRDVGASRLEGPTFYWIVIALTAGFLIAFGLLGAALSGVETEAELSAMIANGAAPSIRRWFRANQSGLQLASAGVIGSGLGVLLFWAVTRTDSSVPDPIVPWAAIGVLAIGVPAAVYLMILAAVGDGSPAVSRRGLV